MKLYTSLLRHWSDPIGEWTRDPMPTSLREAKRLATFNRCLGGMQTNIVPANEEEVANWVEENGPLPTNSK